MVFHCGYYRHYRWVRFTVGPGLALHVGRRRVKLFGRTAGFCSRIASMKRFLIDVAIFLLIALGLIALFPGGRFFMELLVACIINPKGFS